MNFLNDKNTISMKKIKGIKTKDTDKLYLPSAATNKRQSRVQKLALSELKKRLKK